MTPGTDVWPKGEESEEENIERIWELELSQLW